MQFSEYQTNIFTAVKGYTLNIAVKAVAGSGKTTTAIEAVKYMKGSVTMLAFNSTIAAVMGQKLAQAGINHAKAFTFHGLGFGALRYAWRNDKYKIVMDEDKFDNKIVEKLEIPAYLNQFVKKLVSHAKKRAFGIVTNINSRESWLQIVDHHDLTSEINAESLKAECISMTDAVKDGLDIAVKALLYSNDLGRVQHLIDFDDMVYLPVLLDINMFKVDWVIVDEAQDSCPIWRALVRKIVKAGGRTMFIGDEKQAINGFAGADNDAFAKCIQEFNCTELPLTRSYRCSKESVKFVQQWVPYIEAADSNLEGSISYISWNQFCAGKFNPETDAVICRNTAPLVVACYKLIAKGVPCQIRGRKDVGEGLIKLITRWKGLITASSLATKLEDYSQKQCAKYEAAGKEMLADNLNDKVEAIFAIMSSLSPAASVADLVKSVNTIFGDPKEGAKAVRLSLSTGHKSKGLEWDNVYWIGRDSLQPSKYARQAWQVQQEINLMYVMGTRNKNDLIEVEMPPRKKKNEDRDEILLRA